ncbi:MAG: 5-(carboxyamino)imidazole ribonucleotide synthase [Verrucomicrobiota bacterium]
MPSFAPLQPGPHSWIGILGGGQLGRMTAMAAQRMGYPVLLWSGGPHGGPATAATEVLTEPFDSEAALRTFLDRVKVVSVEFENIPADLLHHIEETHPLHPTATAITTTQHREREKHFLAKHGFPHAPFSIIDSEDALAHALSKLPASGGVLKTAEFGYDGKGQRTVQSTDSAELIWGAFDSPRAVLEHRIDLQAEVSVIVARSPQGEVVTYPVAENIHRNHILDLTIVPARQPEDLLQKAEHIAHEIAETFAYVGLFAIEYFVSTRGDLLVNEIAPRPHNSGHHTMDSCITSQFENHVRAICGLPLGSTQLTTPSAVMLNLLGDLWPVDWTPVFTLPDTHLHLYGKEDAKQGRKMGHINLRGKNRENLLQSTELLRAQLATGEG